MNKWLKLMALLTALLMLAGCNLIATDPVLDAQQVVAKVGDTEITKGEWLEQTENVLYNNQLMYYYYYGMSYDVTDSQAIADARSTAIDNMITYEVLTQKAAEEGLDVLSEEEQAQVEESVQSDWDSYLDSYTTLYFSDSEMEGEELESAVIARMEQDGITQEALREMYTDEIVDDHLYQFAIQDVEVTDDEVQMEYDGLVLDQQGTLDTTPTLYQSYVSNGTDIYYVPEGYRGIKQILIALDDEQASEISELQSTLTANETALEDLRTQLDELQNPEEGEETTATPGEIEASTAQIESQIAQLEEENATAQTQLDELQTQAYAQIEATASEALEKAQAGEDFDELIATYGEDDGMTQEPYASQGYPVCEGLTAYVTEFQDAAMALEKVGDISGLVKTSYGYHILQYAQDIPSGPVAYETVEEDLRAQMLSEKQSAAYTAKVDEWVAEADVERNERLLQAD